MESRLKTHLRRRGRREERSAVGFGRVLENEMEIDSPEHPPSNLSVGTLTALAWVVELSLLDEVGGEGSKVPSSSKSVESSEVTCEESEGLDWGGWREGQLVSNGMEERARRLTLPELGKPIRSKLTSLDEVKVDHRTD